MNDKGRSENITLRYYTDANPGNLQFMCSGNIEESFKNHGTPYSPRGSLTVGQYSNEYERPLVERVRAHIARGKEEFTVVRRVLLSCVKSVKESLFCGTPDLNIEKAIESARDRDKWKKIWPLRRCYPLH